MYFSRGCIYTEICFAMKQSFSFVLCCLFGALLFSCKHHSTVALSVGSSARGIDSLIKTKEKAIYALLTDTTRAEASADKTSPYYSVTRFYYDSFSKELFKAENILQATAKTTFVAYYSGGRVVKTSAHTEFGWYDDYFLPGEQEGTNENKPGKKQQSPFRQQCLQLAKAQQSIFQRKIG